MSSPPNPNDLSVLCTAPAARKSEVSIPFARSKIGFARSKIGARQLLIFRPPSPDIQLKKPVYLRRPPAPEVIHEPDSLARELRRAAPFSVFGRFVAIGAFVAVVALLFGLMLLPASRQSDARTTPVVTGSISALPQPSQQENGSKPALAEFQGPSRPRLLASLLSRAAQQQLLQQFLQWRKKANPTETFGMTPKARET